MAAFDFGSLLQNPSFQFGATLFGNSRQPNAIGNAYSAVQKVQQFKQEQDLQKQQLEQQRQFQQAQMANMEKQRVAEAQRAQAQADAEVRKQALFERQQRMQEQMMGAFPDIFGGSSQPMPEQPAGPQGAVTPELLDSLAQVESSNNPNAVNPDSGAQGLFQFMPATAKQYGINPMNPQEARNGAQRYLTTLTQQNGGSLERALAAYGGFKTKDPTAYIQKVMSGAGMSPQQGAPGAPIPTGNTGTNPSLRMQRAAVAAGLAGMGAGVTGPMSELGKSMAPQHVQPGYERDSAGNMRYIQDPTKTAELAQGQQRIDTANRQADLEAQRTAATVDEKNLKVTAARESDLSGYHDISSAMDRLLAQTDELMKHPGLPSNTGLSGIAKVYNLTQEGRDANVLMESVKGKLVIDTLLKMKALSKNGSSGFGQLSDKEGTRLETYIANLSKAQSLPAMKKALGDIRAFANSSKAAFTDRVRKIYGDEAIGTPPQNTTAPAEDNVLTLDQYISKHKK